MSSGYQEDLFELAIELASSNVSCAAIVNLDSHVWRYVPLTHINNRKVG